MNTSTPQTPAEIFARPGTRRAQRVHTAPVVDVSLRSPHMLRVTLAGPDLADLGSTGPADHVRVFFPGADPWSREPTHEPDRGPVIHRDFTPLPVRGEEAAVALDFALHPAPGPASGWAAAAQVGMSLSLAGPRGSRGVPVGAEELWLIGDESALPSISRWIAESDRDVRVRVVASLRAPEDLDYLGAWSEDDRVQLSWHPQAEDLLTAVEALGPVGPRTFVFAAAEAAAVRPVRRHLRRTLGLPPEQVAVSGYWRTGTAGYDHHLPLDPDDPDPRPGRPAGATR